MDDISKKLADLQAWAIGEVSWIESLIFYVVFIFIAYVLTSVPCSQSARIPILLILSSGIAIEQGLHELIINTKIHQTYVISHLKEDMYYWIWRERALLVTVCVVIYLYKVYHYTDYNQVNHLLLTKVSMDVAQMSHYFLSPASPQAQGDQEGATSSTNTVVSRNIFVRNDDQVQGKLLHKNVELIRNNACLVDNLREYLTPKNTSSLPHHIPYVYTKQDTSASPTSSPSVRVADSSPSVRVADSSPSVRVADSSPSVRVADSSPSVRVADSSFSVRAADSSPSVHVADSSPSVHVTDNTSKIYVAASHRNRKKKYGSTTHSPAVLTIENDTSKASPSSYNLRSRIASPRN